jgi:glycopeptide antibiotics resistance protein
MSWVSRSARILLVVYSVLLALALFSPSSSQQSGAVLRLGELLTSVGVPADLATYPRLEVLMNAVIVVPVTLLGSLVRPQWSWRDWTAGAFVLAVAVEVVQGVFLPGREATFSDVVANTAGALAGALVVSAVRSMLGAPKTR